ncbi:MAG TPA: hypothetical protein VFV50_04065, partial [Bdellovibrionales bacterium]|nr:hypothetical protein [Bdellovibrionales bacterium]
MAVLRRLKLFAAIWAVALWFMSSTAFGQLQNISEGGPRSSFEFTFAGARAMTLVFYPEHGVYVKRTLLPNKKLIAGKVHLAPSNDVAYGNAISVGPQSYAYSGSYSAERTVNMLTT